MAKENFDRSKPHIRIGGVQADFGFVGNDGTLQIINYEDNNADGFVAVNIAPTLQAICVDDPTAACVETSRSPDQFQWTAFAQPLLETDDGTPLPLLTTLNLDQVGRDGAPVFSIGQTLQVNDGAINEWSLLSVRDAAPLSSVVGDPLNTPGAFTGTARVVGFVEYLIPEPTSLMLLAATAAAALAARPRQRENSRNPGAKGGGAPAG